MPSRLVIGLLLALLVLGATALYASKKAWEYQSTLQTITRERDALRGRLTGIQSQVQKAEKESEDRRVQVQEALDAAPAWRDTSVPEPVTDGLCVFLRCR